MSPALFLLVIFMKKKFEFSKLVLCLVMATYFAGLIFGMDIILHLSTDNSSYIATALCGLFSYIGAPVAVSIGFYAYKAKAENVEKIRSSAAINTIEDIPCEESDF